MNNIRYALKNCNNYAIGIFDNDLLIGYALADFKRFVIFNINLSDEDAYFWDVYVHKDYRGKKICQDLYNTLIEKSLQLGKRRALSYVDSYNKASHKTHKRQQYRILQKVVTINGWGIRYSSLKLPI